MIGFRSKRYAVLVAIARHVSDLTVTQNGSNTVITVPGGGTITLQGFTSTDLDANDFVFHEEQQDGI